MQAQTFPELEALFGRLPITAENFGTFEALLRLPYDIYRPVMDLMFAGQVFPEDITGNVQDWAARALKLADSQAAAAVIADNAPTVAASAITAALLALAAGVTPGAVVLQRDQTAVGLDPTGRELPAYAPASLEIYGRDADMNYPNAIEVVRAGSVPSAKKQSSERFGASQYPKVD